jgi:ABC-type uncharacterized transport system involved in gliding motility auxiliary subunit
MPTSHFVTDSRSRERGAAPALVLHVLLLLVVLAQIVYLASRQRVRVDLTSDGLWSTTSSTRDLLQKLDKRLVVEAYFSPKDKLPVAVRETRAWADSFLDELAQLGRGNVVVQRFDPNADKAVKDKATRVGIKPLELRSQSSTSLSVDVHWQGLRFVYGGDKNKVVPQFAPSSSFLAEAVITPAIKEVITSQKRRIGYMEWPATNPQGAQAGPLGWNVLRTLDGIAKRYEFQNLKDEDGALLPDDLQTLFLFRPKDLTDRQKYALDQFVVKGGTLVAFVDAAEYLIGPQRAMTKVPLALDAAGSAQKFTDQLLHYGVDWKPRLVADLMQAANQPRDPVQGRFEYFAVPQLTPFGQQLSPVEYPYFFHPVAVEWKDVANDLAKDARGQVDKDLAEQYRKLFVPGMPSDEFVFQAWKQQKRGPGFYWPTWVGLRTKAGGAPDLPPDVDGRVLLWSSPAALVEDPPQTLNPIGFGDGQQRLDAYQKFTARLRERLAAEPRQQAPLMVEVKGRFSSFFAGQERPLRPSEVKEAAAKKAEAEARAAQAAEAAKAGEPPPAEPSADADAAAVVAEAAKVDRSEKPGRIVVVGDADFLRDDIVRGDHAQAGGPVSGRAAAPFFAQMLDWLAEDKDLVALQSKVATDRSLKLLEETRDPNADPRLHEQALRRKTTWLRTLNVVLPGALLAALGLGVYFVRRAQKRTFLSSIG